MASKGNRASALCEAPLQRNKLNGRTLFCKANGVHSEGPLQRLTSINLFHNDPGSAGPILFKKKYTRHSRPKESGVVTLWKETAKDKPSYDDTRATQRGS